MATAAEQTTALARKHARYQANIEWYGDRLEQGLSLTMQQRLRVAGQLLRDKIAINLSKPVYKEKRRRTRETVKMGDVKKKGSTYTWVDPASRSKPGEFPRADMTRLMKDVFYDMPQPNMAIVGTTLGYGLRLEMEMDRSFLRRTLYEMEPIIRDILTREVPGAAFGMT